MSITNAALAQQISELVAYWRTRDTEYAAWLAGTATGGPYSNGTYPLTNYVNSTIFVKSPAALQASVDGMADSAAAFADDAEASATAAAASAVAAQAARDLALSYQTGAQAARDLAESYKNYAASSEANAQAAAAAAAADAASINGDVAAADASATAAAASAAAAAASAAAAATFDPANFYTKTAADARYLQDAPSDGSSYARKDGAWATVTGGSGGGGYPIGAPAYMRVKQSNQSLANSTTYTTATDLTFDAVAGKSYYFEILAPATFTSTPGFKQQIVYSGTASNILYSQTAYQEGQQVYGRNRTAFPDPGSSSVSDTTWLFKGTFKATTAGTLAFQFAQNTSNASAVSVLAGAYIKVYEILGYNPGDPWWNYVVALFKFDGADGDTTFYDLSPYARPVSRFGQAQLDDSQKKFGTTSLLLDGTGDYLTVPDADELSVLAANFTLEAWIRRASTGTIDTICNKRPGSGSIEFSFSVNASNVLVGTTWDGPVIATVAGTTTIAADTWYHVAFTRNGNVWTLWLNGNQEATTTASGTVGSGSAPLYIGRDGFDTSRDFHGWIDSLRFTRGVCRYTGPFTPPTEDFPTGMGSLEKLDDLLDVNVTGVSNGQSLVWDSSMGSWTTGSRLALTGGTLTGALTVNTSGSQVAIQSSAAVRGYVHGALEGGISYFGLQNASAAWAVRVNSARSVRLDVGSEDNYTCASIVGSKDGYSGLRLANAVNGPVLMFNTSSFFGGLYAAGSNDWILYYDGSQWRTGNAAYAIPHATWGARCVISRGTGTPTGGADGDVYYQYT